MQLREFCFKLVSSRATLPVVGLVDLLTTLVWLQAGCVVEANPIMAALLRVGLAPFLLVKLSTLVAYVVTMEWYARRRPEAARFFTQVTTLAYVTVYSASFLVVNRPVLFG
jgi:hypothetical protein